MDARNPGRDLWDECGAPRPGLGDEVQTACGGVVRFSFATPCVQIQDEMVYFCLPICLEACERDANCSCMAGRGR